MPKKFVIIAIIFSDNFFCQYSKVVINSVKNTTCPIIGFNHVCSLSCVLGSCQIPSLFPPIQIHVALGQYHSVRYFQGCYAPINCVPHLPPTRHGWGDLTYAQYYNLYCTTVKSPAIPDLFPHVGSGACN